MYLLNLTNDYRCSLPGCKQHISLCTAASRQPCSEWIKTARKSVWKLPCQSLHYTIKGLFLSLSNNCQGTQQRKKSAKEAAVQQCAPCQVDEVIVVHIDSSGWIYLCCSLTFGVSDVNKPLSITIKLWQVQRWAFISIWTYNFTTKWVKEKNKNRCTIEEEVELFLARKI